MLSVDFKDVLFEKLALDWLFGKIVLWTWFSVNVGSLAEAL